MTTSRQQTAPLQQLPRLSALSILVALALALPASAQEGFGLDLSDVGSNTPEPAKPKKTRKDKKPKEAPPPPEETPVEQPGLDLSPSGDGGLGLDLSGSSGPDMRPTLAVLGVFVKPIEGVTASPADEALALQITSTLLAEAGNGQFRVMAPDEASTMLADGYEAAMQCAEAACFGQTLDGLDVERVLGAQLMVGGRKEVTLRLHAFARRDLEVDNTDVESRGPPGAAFQQAIAAATQPLLQKLSTPLAQLKVSTNVPDALVSLGDRPVGSGSLEKLVSSGRHTLRVTAAGRIPFERDLTLEPGQTLDVDAHLSPVALVDPDLDAVKKTPAPAGQKPAPTFRPGWLVALGGVLVAGVGAGLGASAQAVADRAKDANGDGVLDVTRQVMLNAQGNATLANVLMVTGGAVAVGGGLWFLLAPTAPAAPASAALGGTGGTGFSVMAGGTF